ncbi:MAG: family 78 glycoside hydrolase catalytic domain [Puniceicoccaceae bacterium]
MNLPGYTRLAYRCLLILLGGSGFLSGMVVVEDLTCGYSTNPLGVDNARPHLFWRLTSDEQGQRQTAYRILVASDKEALASDVGDLWDSGIVKSDQTTHVKYDGVPLTSSQNVYWKVQAWDRNGNPTAWSEPAQWTMGILESDEWQGNWITSPEQHESILLRRDIELSGTLTRAVMHVSGLGHCVVSINGQRVGQKLLAPGWTDYDKTTLYDTYDITNLLQNGDNAIGALLGNGMYHVERRGRFAKFVGSFGPKRLMAHILLEFEDGSREIVSTDEQWLTHSGPITFSSIYGGEDYDARLLPDGWDLPGFNSADWDPAVILDAYDTSTLKGHSASAHPVVEIEARLPVEVRPLAAPGAALYDFGQNTSYMPRLTVTGPKGSRVILTPGELIYPDGYITRSSMGGVYRGYSWCEYIKATDDAETWMPEFFYIGSRYIQTQAVAAEEGGPLPVIETLEGVIVHSSAEPLGRFTTSNNRLNQTRELVRWAQRSNMVSVLTDCPHREKLGWLEQYHLNGPAIRYEFDVAKIYTKGMNDMADGQTADGLIPNIAPEYTQFRGTFRAAAEWGAAFILVPWQQYRFSADTSLIRKHYPAMKRYFAYLESKAVDNILEEGLGDWYDLGPRAPGRSQLTFPPLTATAFLYRDAVALSKMASLVGQEEDSAYFNERAEEIRESFNATFFNREAGFYGGNSQAANAIPLVFGIVEPEYRKVVLENLVQDVVENDYRMTAGDVGFRFLIQALSEGGRDGVVYRMINHDRNPGYRYQLKMGATALTESWDADRNSSNNHFMLGHITEWFYEDLLGIEAMEDYPGFKRVRINPSVIDGLSWVEGGYESLHGPIRVRWDIKNAVYRLAVEIPANTSAEVHLPAMEPDRVRVNGRAIADIEWIQEMKQDSGKLVLLVASGSYVFEVNKPELPEQTD